MKPQPPPEAVLIRLAREAAHIRTGDAAKAAGVSKARWSQVESGYESRLGGHKPVVARAVTLAHMAHAVGVTPERLAAAGREDAAEILREILHREGGQAPPPQPRYSDPNLQAIWELNLPEKVRLGMIALARDMREADENGNGAERPA